MDKNDDFEDKANENEDEFGLPDMNYESLDQESSQSQHGMHETDSSSEYTYEDEDEEGKSKAKTIGIIVIVVLIAMGGIYGYFFHFQPKMEREKQEELAKQERVKQAQEKARLAKLQKEEEQAKQKAVADSIASAQASPQPHANRARGTIGKLGRPIGRYHIVISSAMDDDLLVDYAKVLRRKGVSTKLISPYGKVRLHRLTINEDYDTFAQAQQKINEIGAGYKYGSWVLKY